MSETPTHAQQRAAWYRAMAAQLGEVANGT